MIKANFATVMKRVFITSFGVTAFLPLCNSASFAQVVPTFVEQTQLSGISTKYEGEWEFMVGGGVAVFDCNNDQYPDVFVPGGATEAGLYQNTSTRGGDLKFKKHKSGLELTNATGGYPLDIDSDGNIDLVMLRIGENLVMRGKGNCQFERANETWNFNGGDGWSTSFSATWEKGSDWPTIAIGNYINRFEEISPWGSCTENFLHRGAEKKFSKATALIPSFCPLSMLFTDWNRSGTPSLRVSNDREYYEGGQEQMWHVTPDEMPKLFTPEEGWKYLRIWGMGIASHDVNGDSFPDYFLTSMADNKLQVLEAVPADGKLKPAYKDIAYPLGVTTHRPSHGEDLRSSTAWHTQFADVNNDGLSDIFIAKGNVDRMPDFAEKDPNNLMLQKPDGKFVDAALAAGVASTKKSRGGAVVDFNLDGKLDLVVTNRRDVTEIWRNASDDAGNWLHVQLRQDGHNRNAIGAWIELKRGGKITHHEVTSGGGHAGGQLGFHHFGLATDTSAELRVLWPDGTKDAWQMLKANGFYEVARGAAGKLVEIK